MWKVQINHFNEATIVHHGNQFLIGNGKMGYRGTLEEFNKEQLVGLNLPGLYDQFEDKWRESVNAPNPFFTQVKFGGQVLNPLLLKPIQHEQILDIKKGIHSRETSWMLNNTMITIQSERFISMVQKDLMVMKYSVTVDQLAELVIETGIDGAVWDINGPHLENSDVQTIDNILVLNMNTQELKIPVVVSEGILTNKDVNENINLDHEQIMRSLKLTLKKDETFTFYKFASIKQGESSNEATLETKAAMEQGYEVLYQEHVEAWDDKWKLADVVITGDEEAQFNLRYSIYHLLILTPTSEYASIPARGISGQTYKGAIFWDTEMFMLPFYLNTDLEAANKLIQYRVHTLDGARRKAKEYGYRGAYYAWESQETGDDACSHFNVTDVFTKRPIRTYFRDKQIHISGDVVYGIWQTYLRTMDLNILINGGAEVIMECARFFYSYGYYNLDQDRFEILDVTGPDEYHERVNNNAFTNRLVLETFTILDQVLTLLKEHKNNTYQQLIETLNFEADYQKILEITPKLYIPQANDNHVIEQFDGYYKLEDVSVEEVKSRLVHPNEYWGGGNGVASSTQIIKQADIVTMLYLFKNDYTDGVKKANWEFYEPRTEHGSSLSACMYALVACDNGNPNWAYPYFMKTASVDLTGKTKQYAGDIYIGGTHPAANGGAYMTAIYGFAGLNIVDDQIQLTPQLPDHWNSLSFKLVLKDECYQITIEKDKTTIVKE
jgi:nigerose phosphorylase